MDQQLYTQAVWFIQRLDKRYAINKGVGWVYALRNSFPGLSPGLAGLNLSGKVRRLSFYTPFDPSSSRSG